MTPEQKQLRIEQIEGQREWRQNHAERFKMNALIAANDDIDFLLSLVKSQEVLSGPSHCALCEDPGFLYRDCVIAAATSMRSACVEKVRQYLTDCRDEERGIIEAIANELESLSIEQPKE